MEQRMEKVGVNVEGWKWKGGRGSKGRKWKGGGGCGRVEVEGQKRE